MAKLIDLTGRVFGRLTVIGRSNKIGYRKSHQWACRCECGTETSVESANLRSGGTTSCGCFRAEHLSPVKVGDTYGKWTVRERFPNKVSGGKKFSYWLCRCECGVENGVFGISLSAGKSKSCGCVMVEVGRKNGLAGLNDLTGQTFGRLTVTRRSKTVVNKPPRWLCDCVCGTETIVAGGSLISGNTISCGCAKRYGKSEASPELQAIRRGDRHRRRAAHKQAFRPFDPVALKNKIKELSDLAHRMEAETGERWDIDHIVPLRAPYSKELGCRIVCGLHNEHNLQLMRYRENAGKNNRYWPGMPAC